MNKVLIKLFVPSLERNFEIWLPLNKRIYNVIDLITKGISEMTEGVYNPKKLPILYNRETGVNYNLKDIVQDTDIVNGSELVLL